MMRIEVINGKAVISKKNLLYSIESIIESMPEELDDTTRAFLARLDQLMGVLAEVIAVEEKDETNTYPFLGTSWEIRKTRYSL